MRASVDPKTCIGCGLCSEMCPEVFEMTDDDISHAKEDDVPADLQDVCREAANQCPVEAIKILP